MITRGLSTISKNGLKNRRCALPGTGASKAYAQIKQSIRCAVESASDMYPWPHHAAAPCVMHTRLFFYSRTRLLISNSKLMVRLYLGKAWNL
jgi:hypothetical protein